MPGVPSPTILDARLATVMSMKDHYSPGDKCLIKVESAEEFYSMGGAMGIILAAQEMLRHDFADEVRVYFYTEEWRECGQMILKERI